MKSSSKMTDVKAAGVIGAMACAIALAEFPMWLMGGEMPQFSDMTAFSEFATRHSTLYLTRTLMDLFIFSLLLVFFGGFRHLVVMTQASSEWLATTFVGIGAVYTAVTLVSDSLTGSIALDTVGGKADPTVIRALNESTVLMFGSVWGVPDRHDDGHRRNADSSDKCASKVDGMAGLGHRCVGFGVCSDDVLRHRLHAVLQRRRGWTGGRRTRAIHHLDCGSCHLHDQDATR